MLAGDTSTFSNDFGHMVGKVGIAAEQDPGGLGFADPPAHTRLRRMLTPHFTTRALAQRAPRVHQIVEEAFDEVARLGADGAPVDLQQHFAVPIPSRVIMELLGVPDTDQQEFHRLSTARFDFSAGAAGSLDVIQEAIDYLVEIVARQRVEPVPGLISTVLAEYGDDIDDVELAGLADGVLTGGLETTVSMLALGALVLMQDEHAAAALREPDAPVDDVVEELLRYLSVVQVGFPRFAARDVQLGGRQILRGDAVLPSLSAANRDERHGARLNRFDAQRLARRPSGLRSRAAPLRRRRARPPGAADGLSGPAATLSPPAPGRRPRRARVPRPVLRLRHQGVARPHRLNHRLESPLPVG